MSEIAISQTTEYRHSKTLLRHNGRTNREGQEKQAQPRSLVISKESRSEKEQCGKIE
jgi:hypothetical protein